ncbi:MAG: NifX-associated nitrogen fixation protein [Alphaproteobacteria bacterium]|nr:NifX-associated nitrogen fixation protein [Alphaproteobacteria bacterium]
MNAISPTGFVAELIRQIRAQDAFGAWARKSEADLLEPYIVDKEKRKSIPIISDPDPDVIDRVEMFYRAIGLAVEKRTGLIASPILKINHEGFGRVVLLAGNLVVLSKHLRDVHRFGFETLEKLEEEGSKLTGKAVEMIERFPEVAKL